MPEKGTRSPYSQSPFQILIHDSLGLLSTGTAFLYSFDKEVFLITNWHNVSSKHPFEKKYLTNNHRGATIIKAKIAHWIDQTNSKTFDIQPFDIPLYDGGAACLV